MTTGTALLFLRIPVFIFGRHYLGWMGKDAPQRYLKVVRCKIENNNL